MRTAQIREMPERQCEEPGNERECLPRLDQACMDIHKGEVLVRTPLDSRPCRSFAEAFFDRTGRQLEQAERLRWIDSACFRLKDNSPERQASS